MKQIYNKQTKVADLINDSAEVPGEWTEQHPRWCEFEAWDLQNDCWGISFDLIKEKKKKDITQAFDNELSNGKFMSAVLGIEVDYRRGANKNDMQNVQALISYMERNEVTSIVYRGADHHTEATLENLKTLLHEMEDYGLYLYQKKWSVRDAASRCETQEELDEVNWE